MRPLLIGLWIGLVVAGCGPRPAPVVPTAPPTLRPTFAFPTGTPVPITSADNQLIETEPGPLYVMLSTVDEHGLRGAPLIELMSQPDPVAANVMGSVPSGSFAQVLEIRRLPPDFLRTFYRVRAQNAERTELEGWVSDWYVRRTAFVVVFDAQKCACPFSVPLWADAGLSQPAGTVENRSPLRVLALGEQGVQVQVLSTGTIGWLSRQIVFESQEKEFLKYIAPKKF